MKFKRILALAAATVTSTALLVAVPSSADGAGVIQITKVYVNSPGSDTGSNSSLNAEYVKIKNTGTSERSLTGWTLRDESNHIYTFGSYKLGAGKTVTVRSGKGDNTTATKYWQKSWYVWNNSGGDSASLRNRDGAAMDKCSWGTVSSYVTC